MTSGPSILPPVDPNHMAGFLPIADSTICAMGYDATTTSAAVHILPISLSDPGLDSSAVPNCISIWNVGANIVFCAIGGSSTAATVPTSTAAGSFPVAPSNGYVGAAAVLALHPAHRALAAQGELYLAAITGTSTSQIYFSPGSQGVGAGG